MSTPCYPCTGDEQDDSQPVPPVVADVQSSPRPKKKAKPVIQHTKSLWQRRGWCTAPDRYNLDDLAPNQEIDSPPYIEGTMGSVMGCPKDREFQARKRRQEQLENEMEENMCNQEPNANIGRWLGYDNNAIVLSSGGDNNNVIVLSSDSSSDSSSSNSSSIEYDSD